NTRLTIGPVVLEDVAINHDVSRVLHLEQVLHCPVITRVSRITDFPAQRFENIVTTNLDVGGNEIDNTRIGAAKHDVLAGGFEIVVDDVKGTRTVPTGDG